MAPKLFNYAIQYACFFLEAGLLACICFRGAWKRLYALLLYVACLLGIGGGRAFVLSQYGLHSRKYFSFYWVSDVILALGLFLLVCAFFRRATAQKEELWRFVRLLLVFVFIIVLGISFLSLSRNYTNLSLRFIGEFQQNLYFTCLVLNTLLYILMQQLESDDEELGLLVCGVGLQLAGPAANFALMYLMQGHPFAVTLITYLSPLCALGMLLTWFYAIIRIPKPAKAPVHGKRVAALAKAV